jgi:fermentation-respiration switch protein FrsA (DUF1100 family)
MGSWIVKLVLVLLVAYAAIVGSIWFFQDRLVYYPHKAHTPGATPGAVGAAYDDFGVKTEDGETLNVWWVPAASPKGAVLFLHGNAGNISQRIDYALMFKKLGYSTMLVDYRGYGKSSGKPSEQGTYRDAEAAWRWLTRERGFPERNIVIFGESLGGGVGSWLAARHKPRALVLESTFTSALDLGAELYRFIPVRLISRLKYDTLRQLEDVDAPVMIIHSRSDDIVPFSHAERLYAAAKSPKAFLEIYGTHNNGSVYMRPEWVDALNTFLKRAESNGNAAQRRS